MYPSNDGVWFALPCLSTLQNFAFMPTFLSLSVIVVMHPLRSLTFPDWCQGRKMTLFNDERKSEVRKDAIPIARKYTSLVHFLLFQKLLLRPFSICLGRKLLKTMYSNFYVSDTSKGVVLKVTDLTINSSCEGTLQGLIYDKTAMILSYLLV